MKNMTKRALSWLLALSLLVSLLMGFAINVSATEESTVTDVPAVTEEIPEIITQELTAASEESEQIVPYASYIYNWGTRGKVATPEDFEKSNAEDFYTGSYTFENLMALDGSATVSSVPGSALYKTLQSLMSDRQTYETSYGDTRDLFKYTDCQNGGGKISSFYSGTAIGPNWDSGKTWNREHTWPNSKGDASGNGENDLMMLRPTSVSENSGRGNTAYGEGVSFYDPNKESGGKYNLHGDVARIMLYVYCRWGNTEKMWGSTGVMESVDVLLKWVEEDPVDTWELGRNDAAESILGTRNVFVDYPELIFQLFGEEVPAGYQTPSGSVSDGTTTETTLYFVENGTVTSEEITYEGTVFELPEPTKAPADGWSFLGWVEKTVDETTDRPDKVYSAGAAYKVPAGGKTFYALYTMFDGEGEADTFTLAEEPKDGDRAVIYHPGSGYAVAGKIKSSAYLDYGKVTVSNGKIVTADTTVIWTVTDNGDGTFTFSNGGNTMSVNDNGSKFALVLDGANPKIALNSCNRVNSSFYLYSADQKGSKDRVYLEWIQKYLDFAASDTDTSNISESGFGFQFYTVSGTSYYTTTTADTKTYQVSFRVDPNSAPIDSVTADSLGITLPTVLTPTGCNFVGWVTKEVDETKTAPETIYPAGSTYIPTRDVTLYALYSMAMDGIALVTEDTQLQAGDQLILGNYTYSAVAGIEEANKEGGMWLTKQTATFDAETGELLGYPDDTYVFTLGGTEDAWTLNTAAGALAVNKADNGRLDWVSANNTWIITVDQNGDAAITNAWSGGRPEALRYNKTSGQERFANYDGSVSKLPLPQLYRVQGGLTYATRITIPCRHVYEDHFCIYCGQQDPDSLHLSECTVEVGGQVEYTGAAATVDVAIHNPGGDLLAEGRDYILTYEHNDTVGVATVTVEGAGNYFGTVTKEFDVVLGQVQNLTVTYTTGTAVEITFDAVAGAEEYWIYRSGSRKARITDTAYTMTGLTAGTKYTFYVKAAARVDGEDWTGQASETVAITPRNDFAGCTVTLSYGSTAYTGTARKPSVTVRNASGDKISSSYYSVSYADNTEMGVATVTVTGKSKYEGQATATFLIVPGKGDAPDVSYIDGVSAEVEIDTVKGAQWYDIYVDGVLNTRTAEDTCIIEGLKTNVTQKVTVVAGAAVEGMELTGAMSSYDSVTPKHKMEQCNIALSQQEYVYTGSYHKPDVTVIGYGGVALTEGADYTVKYSSNKNTGKATVTVTGKGDYTGSVKAYFVINPVQVTGLEMSAYSTGSVTVRYDKASGNSTKYYEVYVDGKLAGKTTSGSYTIKKLTPYEKHDVYVVATKTVSGVTYESQPSETIQVYIGPGKGGAPDVSYVNGVSALVEIDTVKDAQWYDIYVDGEFHTRTAEDVCIIEGLKTNVTQKVTVRAVVINQGEEFVGLPSSAASVTPKHKMEQCNIALSQQEYVYTGSYHKPDVTVIGYGGVALTEGADYTVKYSSNKNTGKATVTVTGKGDYTGSVKEYFVIKPAQVDGLQISSTTASSVKIKFTKSSSNSTKYYEVYVNGKPAGKTTSSSYTIRDLELYTEYEVYVVGTKTVSGVAYEGQPSETITVRPGKYIGSYKGYLDEDEFVYSGEAFTPGVTLKTSSGGSTLEPGVDYTVRYENNVAPGKAKVIFEGIGEYAGTLTKTFTIAPRQVQNVNVTADRKSISVSFDEVEGATSYWVYVNGSRKAKITDTQCTVTGLKTNRTYKVTVKAVVTVDGSSYTGEASETYKVTTLK